MGGCLSLSTVWCEYHISPLFHRMKNVLELLDKNYHIHASLNSTVSSLLDYVCMCM